MDSAKAIAEAKRLLKKGELETARELLLAAGFVDRLDPDAQLAYERLVPAPASLTQQLSGILDDLGSKQPRVRERAARKLSAVARKEFSLHTKEWLGDPRATGRVFAALDDADDRVVQHAVVAAAMTIIRYLRDLRAFEPLARLLDHPKPEVRFWAVRGAARLRHKERWKVLLPMLSDDSSKVRLEICKGIMASADTEKPGAAVRAQMIAALMPALDDREPGVRECAANALLALGERKVVAELRVRLGAEPDDEVRENLERVIAVLEGAPDPYRIR
jgi:HEAT repeat protein